MKYTLLTGLALMAMATHTDAQTIAKKLSGTWTVTDIAVDANGNKTMDKGEQVKANTLGLYVRLNEDGTGIAHIDIFSKREDKVKWSTGNNNTELVFSGEGNADKALLGYKLADGRNTYHIDKLSGNTLTLSSNNGETVWLSLKKK